MRSVLLGSVFIWFPRAAKKGVKVQDELKQENNKSKQQYHPARTRNA